MFFTVSVFESATAPTRVCSPVNTLMQRKYMHFLCELHAFAPLFARSYYTLLNRVVLQSNRPFLRHDISFSRKKSIFCGVI